MRASVPEPEYWTRRERVESCLRELGLPLYEYGLDDLLWQVDLPSADGFEARFAEDDVLSGRGLPARYVADRLVTALRAANAPVDPRLAKLDEYKDRLSKIASGHTNFRGFEKLACEIWTAVFADALTFLGEQSATRGGVLRRDGLYRNNRDSRFWVRVAQKFNADLIVVDFKNYSKPVSAKRVWDIERYADDLNGRMLVIVSRHGRDSTVLPAQLTALEKHRNLVLVVGDTDLLTMIDLKKQGEDPGSFLEKQMDSLLAAL